MKERTLTEGGKKRVKAADVAGGKGDVRRRVKNTTNTKGSRRVGFGREGRGGGLPASGGRNFLERKGEGVERKLVLLGVYYSADQGGDTLCRKGMPRWGRRNLC